MLAVASGPRNYSTAPAPLEGREVWALGAWEDEVQPIWVFGFGVCFVLGGGASGFGSGCGV